MSDDLDDLYAAAEAATPGPWYDGEDGSVRAEHDAYALASTPDPEDAAYLAAANPSVVKALIDRVRAAEARVQNVVRSYELKVEDFAAETRRASDLATQLDALTGGEDSPRHARFVSAYTTALGHTNGQSEPVHGAAAINVAIARAEAAESLLNATDKDAQPVRGDGYHCDRCRAEERT